MQERLLNNITSLATMLLHFRSWMVDGLTINNNASNQDLLQATLKEQILNLILALCVLSCLSFDNGRCTQETTPPPWWWQHDHHWDNEKDVHDSILVTNIILILTIIIKLWKAGVSVWEPPTSWPSHTKLGNWGVNLWHRSSNQFE